MFQQMVSVFFKGYAIICYPLLTYYFSSESTKDFVYGGVSIGGDGYEKRYSEVVDESL